MSVKKIILWCIPLCFLAITTYYLKISSHEVAKQVTKKSIITVNKLHSEAETTQPLSLNDLEKSGVAEKEEKNITLSSDAPWLSLSSTDLSSSLYNFIESEGLRYVDVSTFPFNPQTEKLLRKFSQSGEILLFDNTATDRLGNIAESPADIIADYYGSVPDGDVIIATNLKTANGENHFMVLPIIKKEGGSPLPENVKLAVTLIKQEKMASKLKRDNF